MIYRKRQSVHSVQDVVNALYLQMPKMTLIITDRPLINIHMLSPPFSGSHSDIEYTYHVRRVPYVDYNMKQSQPLALREDLIADPASQSVWRLLRKRYSVRVEFDQAGSLGECL